MNELATLILVTHSAEVAAAASRRIEMRDGRIVSDRTCERICCVVVHL